MRSSTCTMTTKQNKNRSFYVLHIRVFAIYESFKFTGYGHGTVWEYENEIPVEIIEKPKTFKSNTVCLFSFLEWNFRRDNSPIVRLPTTNDDRTQYYPEILASTGFRRRHWTTRKRYARRAIRTQTRQY